MVAMGNKKTHEGTFNPVKPKKKKWKSDNSALVRFLKILIIINTFLLNRIIKFDNSNNNSDYIIIVIYAGEEPTPRPAMEP